MIYIKILTNSEINSFNNPPLFNSEERKRFFYLSDWVLNEITTFKNDLNKIAFILTLGYFKASKQFYSPNTYYEYDLRFIANKLDISLTNIDINNYNRRTMNRYKKIILSKLGYTPFSNKILEDLKEEARHIVQKGLKPKTVLSELLNYLVNNKIEIPKYYTLAVIVTDAINKHENHLLKLIESNITEEQILMLDNLLEINKFEDDNKSEIQGAVFYKLTLLKKINQSLRPKKISDSVHNYKYIKSLYEKLSKLIQILNLSPDIVEYYANIVLKSDIRNIVRRKDSKRYLHLISFVIHGYYKHHDSLVDILLKSV